jgi:ribosome-binding factor A
MPSYKNARLTQDVKRELSDIMRGLKDPRITGMLSIVRIDLAGDYSHCTVYISSLDGLEAAKGAVVGLESAAGLVRKEIGKRIRMRRTPEFHFVPDGGIAHSADITKKLRDLG